MFPATAAGSAKRWSFGTLALLILSLLLHLAVLRSVVSLPGLGAGRPAQPAIVQLLPLPPVLEPKPAPPRPAKPAGRRPRAKPAAPRPAAAVPAPAPELAPIAKAAITAPATPALTDEVSPGVQGEAGMPADSASSEDGTGDAGEGVMTNTEPPLRASAPPSASLQYTVDATREGAAYQGRGTIRFTNIDGNYVVNGDARLLFFSVLEFRSSGTVGEDGLAPVLYTEKRFRRSATNTHFQREQQLISFSSSTVTYARRGDEQDRASIVWQLASIGRADAAQLAPGRQFSLFVAGVRDGDNWILQVLGEESLQAAGRQLQAVHVVRHPRPGSYEQRIDIWLAPALEWYPVKLRFTETSGDFLDMNLAEAPQPLHQE